MPTRRQFAAGITAISAGAALSACGTRNADTGSNTGSKTVKIGVISPTTGDLSAFGLGIRNSVELAIKRANDAKAISGWTIEMAAQDDQKSADVGKNAANKLADDDGVIGVVGPLNSNIGQTVAPVLNTAGIVEVSPANTNPALTQGDAFATSPKRPYKTYFRTCTTDSVQGPFAAQYLFDSGIKSVATVHDKKTYGQGLVEAFTKQFTKLGGKIVAAETINPDDKDYSAVITNIKPKSPQALYYGGEYPQSGPLSKQMKAAGLKIPLMGGDGMFDPKYIEAAGADAAGDLVTSVGAPAETLPSAKEFVDAYAKAGYSDPFGAYGAYSYDAANAIIEAMKVSLASAADAKSARPATVDAMSKVSFDGATGKVAFDQYGDTVSRVLTVYKVSGGKWKSEKTGDFPG
ncbi:MAG: branched-chain amino acid ABC transporter substrate-binding protein [Propionibacteriaceae bacterium]